MNRKKIEEPEIYGTEAQHLLWSVHLKATPGRVALLDLLNEEKHPVSIAHLESRLRKISAGLAAASIYRALDSLVSVGLVNRIDTGTIHATYEIRVGRRHHHHLICMGCGDIEDSEKCLPKGIEHTVLADSKKFASLSRHSLEFFGTCIKCAK
ncbi:MAG: Fur family transcriptional regulator [Patescibacteria group bacterium]